MIRHTSLLRSFLPFHKRVVSLSSTTSLRYLSSNEQARVNLVGIQYLSESLHKKLFPTTGIYDYKKQEGSELGNIAQEHLENNDLLGKKTQITEPITINSFPDLIGNSLDEHFNKLGQRSSEHYRLMANEFFHKKNNIPPLPQEGTWLFQPGWTRYTSSKQPESVPHPLEDSLVFDVEVVYKISNYPVLAVCASLDAWYGWVSPVLMDIAKGKQGPELDWNHLIPMDCATKKKLIVGYNVSYDRARILEEYNIKQTKAFYLDGMGLHVAISGICSQQRPTWQKHNKSKKIRQNQIDNGEDDESVISTADDIVADIQAQLENDPWLEKGAPNSLANVYEFHCNSKLDKTDRDYFSTEEPKDISDNFNKLMHYCAKDVEATYKVSKKLFPIFLQRVPHPVSFAALRHMGTLILPTSTKWEEYIKSAESCYEENRAKMMKNLQTRAMELIEYIEKDDPSLEPEHETDPWLSQLDWTLKELRIKKDGTPWAKQAYLTGYPEWYRDLFKTRKDKMNVSLRTRVTPLLLRLRWEGYPLFWHPTDGWSFKVPYDEREAIEKKGYTEISISTKTPELFQALRPAGKTYHLFKVPHPDGPAKRCTSILSKQFGRFFDEGTLTSEYEYASDIISLNNEASYWMGNRNRIMGQFVVYNQEGKNKFFKTKKDRLKHKNMGIILPQLASMGTITRRATENTWLTASNAKKNRIGSELKSLIQAPEGYCFVGADVDSEELWIASLVGDSKFGIHGGTALGWMTLEGEKSEKTDLHSKTASILNISRNHAKVFNYGRIYGAGVRFAARLLKQFNPDISDQDAEKTAITLYAKTKGQNGYLPKDEGKEGDKQESTKFRGENGYLPKKKGKEGDKPKSKRLYFGGSESIIFNALEGIAMQDEPRTPVLGAAITDALKKKHLKENGFLTSRTNWTIQSSGVDYLHLLIVSMDYLTEKYNVDARLAITVHDELRYLVKESDKYKAALLLQISNIWTRGMFCEQLGIKEVPQSCAFFSEVDIDHVLRKEVGMECVTPSNPVPIPPGESLNIGKLLELCDHGSILDESSKPISFEEYTYEERSPVIFALDKDLPDDIKTIKLELETAVDEKEFKKIIREKLMTLSVESNKAISL
ncbi:uncharacterized protein J8A68_002154 [[Candida] subhashii]|uniref:DNA-directed DNA polymerase n=1 Tax=[Candida] subhashii TaxID=561895 RepID=A0A8J5QPT5_9ASCO|nr:uncharacterized protein J8A68_002154 [[Candida] subhashii]KAG7664335.1 hypothetical protein J8A68_002154 [[Candida] subhashii]